MAILIVDTGVFVLILGLGFAFTFFAFKAVGNVRGILHIIAVALFAILGAYTAAGAEVSTSITGGSELHYNATGYLIENVTRADTRQVFIASGESYYWISYIFMGLASLNLIIFVKDVWSAQ